MEISMIVAIDLNDGIGRGDDQLAYIKEDLKRFRELTSGHTVVMGRKTFEALPNGALPNRKNVVITRNKDFKAENVTVVNSPKDVFSVCQYEKVFIIGGAEIYKIFLPYTINLYITEIEHKFENVTTFFPDFEEYFWDVVSCRVMMLDEKTGLEYSFWDLKRIVQ